jgi:prolyl-tRNA editing enzyme YbaK/EbsC (Cys-tRNA(Pro) deacylase)
LAQSLGRFTVFDYNPSRGYRRQLCVYDLPLQVLLTVNTPADLDQYIREHRVAAELVEPAHETPTVALAARAMSCHEDQIVKSVLFLIKDGDACNVALVITNGTAQIDYRKLAELFGVGRKRIRLAPPEVVLALTGYPAGGVPPFGYPEPIATFVDRNVLAQPVVFGGGGDERTLMRVTPQELLRVTGARVVDARS